MKRGGPSSGGMGKRRRVEAPQAVDVEAEAVEEVEPLLALEGPAAPGGEEGGARVAHDTVSLPSPLRRSRAAYVSPSPSLSLMERGGPSSGGMGKRRRVEAPQAMDIVSEVVEEVEPLLALEGPAAHDTGVMRTRISWYLVVAAYRGLPDFQKARLDMMGFGEFLRIEPFWVDLPLIQALRERWDPTSRAFLMSWGHMVPNLEDVVRITGLRVDGEAVSGVTYPDYRQSALELLGLEVVSEGRESRTVGRVDIMEVLGLVDARQHVGESNEEFMKRMERGARVVYCRDADDHERVDRDLRRFLFFMLGRLLLGTKGDDINCRFLEILVDLERVRQYAWGAALLAHLIADLSQGTGRETTVGGFAPFLQVWSYYYIPMGRARQGRPAAVPLARRWLPIVSSASQSYQLMSLRRELREYPEAMVVWRPYLGMVDVDQPWVKAGRPRFGRDLWVHCLNEIEPLRLRLTMRTLGLAQEWIEVSAPCRIGRKTRGRASRTDWRVRFSEQFDDWQRHGTPVESHVQDSAEYLRRYRVTYADRLQLMRPMGNARDAMMTDLQARLADTEQQLADTREALDTLRAQQDAMAATRGASSNSWVPVSEVTSLREQLASAVARAAKAEQGLSTLAAEIQEALDRAARAEAEREARVAELEEELRHRPGDDLPRDILELRISLQLEMRERERERVEREREREREREERRALDAQMMELRLSLGIAEQRLRDSEERYRRGRECRSCARLSDAFSGGNFIVSSSEQQRNVEAERRLRGSRSVASQGSMGPPRDPRPTGGERSDVKSGGET